MTIPGTTEELTERLELAGATLLALRVGGVGPAGFRSGMPEVLQESSEAYGYTGERLTPAPPSARDIAAMDQALDWISYIDDRNPVLRRIVGARALVSPTNGRHLHSWRCIGELIGADHRSVKRWHAQGMQAILVELHRRAGLRAPPRRGCAERIARLGRRVDVGRDLVDGVQVSDFA